MEEIRGVIYTGPELGDGADLEMLPESLQALLQVSNGMIAFDGGLHLRGIGAVPDWHSIDEVWTGEHALHRVYSELLPTDVPFAQDCVGDQYLLRDGKVIKLMAEMGYLEPFAEDLREFLTKACDDPVGYLDLEPLTIFQEDEGELEPGMSLHVYPPFCSQEAEEGVTLSAIPTLKRLEFLFDCYREGLEEE